MNTKRGEHPSLRLYLFTHTLIRRIVLPLSGGPTQVCSGLWNRWTKKTRVPLPSWGVHSRGQTGQNEWGGSGKGGCSPMQNKTKSGMTTAPLPLRQLSMLWNTPALWNYLWFPVPILIGDVQHAPDWCRLLGLYQKPTKAVQGNESVFSAKVVSVA